MHTSPTHLRPHAPHCPRLLTSMPKNRAYSLTSSTDGESTRGVPSCEPLLSGVRSGVDLGSSGARHRRQETKRTIDEGQHARRSWRRAMGVARSRMVSKYSTTCVHAQFSRIVVTALHGGAAGERVRILSVCGTIMHHELPTNIPTTRSAGATEPGSVTQFNAVP